MMISILKSKIHNARVTSANLEYVGSITIDKRLVEAVGLYEYEKVLVSNLTNGSRFETYVILGQDEGKIQVNGAAAKITAEGDRIIIMSFRLLEETDVGKYKPVIIIVDEDNKIV